MLKWTYHMVEMHWDQPTEDLMTTINQMGEAGFELVSVMKVSNTAQYYFKRLSSSTSDWCLLSDPLLQAEVDKAHAAVNDNQQLDLFDDYFEE